MFSPIVLETLVVPDDASATARSILDSLALFRISLVGWMTIVVADVAISVVLYLLFESFDRALSMVSAAFRMAYSTILGAYLLHLFDGYRLLTSAGGGMGESSTSALAELSAFSSGFRLALVFFGIHLVLLGLLLKGSKYVPTLLAVLMLVAGIGYVVDGFAAFFLPGRSDVWSMILLTPALLAEVGLTGWLLFKGIRVPNAPTSEPT
jgi:hypothetical protein